jgi:hypothetical protein
MKYDNCRHTFITAFKEVMSVTDPVSLNNRLGDKFVAQKI